MTITAAATQAINSSSVSKEFSNRKFHLSPQKGIQRSEIGRSRWSTYRPTPFAKPTTLIVFAKKQTNHQHTTLILTELNRNVTEYVRSQTPNRFTLLTPLAKKRYFDT